MPRGRSGKRAVKPEPVPDLMQELTESLTPESEQTMSAPTFDFTVTEAPEDYSPDRKNPGRPRTASPFDDLVVEKLNGPYQFIDYTSPEMAEAAKRELHKAKAFHNIGLDIYDNVEESRIEWRSRDKQKRAPRGSKTPAAVQAEDAGDSDE